MTLTEDQVVAALHAHEGILANAATALGVSEDELRAFLAENPAVQRALEAIQRRLARDALDRLRIAMRRGHVQAAHAILDRLGHTLGLGEPTVQLPTVDDPSDVLSRIDAIERQLAGQRIPVELAIDLVNLRLRAIADVHRTGYVYAMLQRFAMEVVRALESHVRDPDARAAVIDELGAVLAAADRGVRPTY